MKEAPENLQCVTVGASRGINMKAAAAPHGPQYVATMIIYAQSCAKDLLEAFLYIKEGF